MSLKSEGREKNCKLFLKIPVSKEKIRRFENIIRIEL